MKMHAGMRKGLFAAALSAWVLVWPGMPALADEDATAHHIECRETWEKDKAKCDKIFERSMETKDPKAEANLFDMAVKCRAEIQAELDRCRDPRRVMVFVRNKAWRKNNEKALSGLSKTLEAADDQCNTEETQGLGKCEKEKSAKKKEKCIASVDKKHKRCLQKSEKAFMAGFKKLKPPSEAMEKGGVKAIIACHEDLRKDLKDCSNKKCVNKGYKGFQGCVKKNAKNAQYKEGSSYKKLAASIQKVVDTSKTIVAKCYSRASKFETEEVAKAKEKGTLKADKKKIQKSVEDFRGDCIDKGNRQLIKAMDAQISQHFES